MEHPLQITFRGLEPTEALTQAVEERASKLEQFFDKIESCRIIVEAPHHHHHKGNLYHVRVRLAVPGEEIVVSRDPPEHAQHEDLYLAINDALKETTELQKRRDGTGRIPSIAEKDPQARICGTDFAFHRFELGGRDASLRVPL